MLVFNFLTTVYGIHNYSMENHYKRFKQMYIAQIKR